MKKMSDQYNMVEDDTWYRCTVCGREGRVGRCCGDETRIPLNKMAIEEQKKRISKQSRPRLMDKKRP